MRTVPLLLALAFASCGTPGEPAAPPTLPPSEPPETTTESPVAPQPTPEPPTPAAVVPSEPPTVALVATPGTANRLVAISLTNRGAAAVELSTMLHVEVEHDGAFAEMPHPSSLRLRWDCATEPGECVTLAPGAELQPPEWLGTWGDMQCVCTRCGPVEPGRYRLVATTCDGQHRIESAPFTMGD